MLLIEISNTEAAGFKAYADIYTWLEVLSGSDDIFDKNNFRTLHDSQRTHVYRDFVLNILTKLPIIAGLNQNVTE